MPDKWEYPWYAAWDLAFQSIPLALVDLDFAKKQLDLMLREFYLHPSGQLPAYEWNFSDVNPPVHAWAALLIYKSEKVLQGQGDIQFLKHVFGKLMLNFTWWVNRKDRFGKNVFEGGFLGLDNIGVFDRSAALPTGGHLEQADGTAWMAFYCQGMLDIALELAPVDAVYVDLAVKFLEHFLWIASAINRMGGDHEGLWDEEDGFYYDLLRYPDGTSTRLKVRSLVGLLPLCATVVFEKSQRELVPQLADGIRARIERMPELLSAIHPIGPEHRGEADRGLLALVTPDKVEEYLGPRKFHFELADSRERIGVATGLALTAAGGQLIFIEASIMSGHENLIMTGSLGEVMKESAQAALSYIRSNAQQFHIPADFFDHHDIHIHIPAGAVPKDGPSAGLPIALALISLLSRRPLRREVALTGELTLSGRLLPVGGMHDKLLAARRAGIRTVIIPGANEVDLKDIPADVMKDLTIVPAFEVEQIVEAVLTS